jgi:hypothetical protein
MKLIPRKKQPEPTPLERAAKVAKLGATGLTAQRVARKSHRNLKFTKRVLTLAGLAAAVAAVTKKLKSGTDAPSTPAYTPPPPASTGATAGTSATAAATASTGTPPVSGNGKATSGPAVEEALADAGVEGSGPDTPEEAAGASEKTVEFLPPVDASGTDDTLDVEAPNQSTPPPPKGK